MMVNSCILSAVNWIMSESKIMTLHFGWRALSVYQYFISTSLLNQLSVEIYLYDMGRIYSPTMYLHGFPGVSWLRSADMGKYGQVFFAIEKKKNPIQNRDRFIYPGRPSVCISSVGTNSNVSGYDWYLLRWCWNEHHGLCVADASHRRRSSCSC